MEEQRQSLIIDLLKEYKENYTKIKILQKELESLNFIGKTVIIQGTIKTKEQISEEIFLLEMRIKIIDEAMSALPELQKKVIERRVIDGEPYFIVCGELHMGERYARQLKKKALQTLERIILRN